MQPAPAAGSSAPRQQHQRGSLSAFASDAGREPSGSPRSSRVAVLGAPSLEEGELRTLSVLAGAAPTTTSHAAHAKRGEAHARASARTAADADAAIQEAIDAAAGVRHTGAAAAPLGRSPVKAGTANHQQLKHQQSLEAGEIPDSAREEGEEVEAGEVPGVSGRRSTQAPPLARHRSRSRSGSRGAGSWQRGARHGSRSRSRSAERVNAHWTEDKHRGGGGGRSRSRSRSRGRAAHSPDRSWGHRRRGSRSRSPVRDKTGHYNRRGGSGRYDSRSRSRSRDRSRVGGGDGGGRFTLGPRIPHGRSRSRSPQRGARERDSSGARLGGKRCGFKNPIYVINPPPNDPKIRYWRERDGLVHDRAGNTYDPETGEMIRAAAGGKGKKRRDGEAAAATATQQQRHGDGGVEDAAASEGNSGKRQRVQDGADGQQGHRQARGGAGESRTDWDGPTPTAQSPRGAQPEAPTSYYLGHSPQHQQATAAGSNRRFGGSGPLRAPLVVPQLGAPRSSSNPPTTRGGGAAAAHTRGTSVTAATPSAASPTRGVGGTTAPPTSITPPALSPANHGGGGGAPGTPPGAGGNGYHPALNPAAEAAAKAATAFDAGVATGYLGVAHQALQHNLLDTAANAPTFTADTLHLEAKKLKREAEARGERCWDAQALLTLLSSAIKFLEWANTKAAAAKMLGGVSSKDHRHALEQASALVTSVAVRASAAVKAATSSGTQGAAADALHAILALANKLAAVACMHCALAQSQSLGAALRAALGGGGGSRAPGTPPGALMASAGLAPVPIGSAAFALPPAAAAAAAPALVAPAALPAAQHPAAHGHAAAAGAGRSPDESATQNSASSTLDLTPPILQDPSSASARRELLTGVDVYLQLLSRWQAAAAATESLVARVTPREGSGSEGAAAAVGDQQSLPAARRVAALLLSVGFESGMWDLLSTLSTARLACSAVLEMLGPENGGGAGGTASAAPGLAGPAALEATAQ